MYQEHEVVSSQQDEITLYTPLSLDEAPHPSSVLTSICNPHASYELDISFFILTLVSS